MAAVVCAAVPARAAALDDVALSWPWALPFVGLLSSIAALPLLVPRLWRAHYGKIALAWSLLTLVPLAALHGVPVALAALATAIVRDYSSFVILLTTLYVVAGGIVVYGRLHGTPLFNTAILALGTAMASVVGTTGAAMILVRPLLRANAARRHNVHVVIFFIFLVANIGGALSPLGDPPLFVGFLHGVDFFWTATHLWRPTALTVALVLGAFVAVDVWYYRQDRRSAVAGDKPPADPIRVRGLVNLALIALVIAASVLSTRWRGGVLFSVFGTDVELQKLARDAAMVAIMAASLVLTRDEHRARNGFTWGPVVEVAKLFAGIFVCSVPVIIMLEKGANGPLAGLVRVMADGAGNPRDAMYFWVTGALSAVLDNAPTYLVFFALAGNDAGTLMAGHAATLAAISMGAVYMGALTYVGNAPNFMIYAMASERGVQMPGFFGYLLWSGAVLLPVFAIITWVFLTP